MALAAPECEPSVISERDSHPTVDDAFAALSAAAPEGWRVELIEGEIHVVPPANGMHEKIVAEVADQVTLRRKAKDVRTFTGIGLYIPHASATGKVVPDLVIAPRDSFDDELEYHDPGQVLLVGEVTSNSTASKDRAEKLRGYARAGIPCYLLIDREAGQATLFTGPSEEHYAKSVTVDISATLPLPEPLGFELDTSEF